jgi:hypothetical protein
MRKFTTFIAVLIAAVGLVTSVSAHPDKWVLAVYFGWWTQDGWQTENISDAPLDLYDVREWSDAAAQIDAARAVGIDAFVIDWLGLQNDNLTHDAFQNLLDASSTRDFSVAALIDLNERDYLSSLEDLETTFDYLFNEAIPQSSYLRIDGRPIIYFWNQERFTVSTWMALRSVYDPNYDTIWMMEGTSAAYMPTFDGMYLMSTAWTDDPVMVMEYWQERAALFGGQYFHPTAAPGWDESAFAGWRTDSSSPRDRAGGDYLRERWHAAAALADDDVILVTSWNGYYENSHVQPSENYGTQTTDLLAQLIADWRAE